MSDNPRPPIQDGLLLVSVLLVGALLALQYDLFWFAAELSEPQRKSARVGVGACVGNRLGRQGTTARILHDRFE
jgi:hypothetical protein